MDSFKINKIFQFYVGILYKESKVWNTKRIFYNYLLPLVIAFFILFTVESINEIKDTVSLILSILVGLLFNFVSGFSDRINSQHLSQNASQKIIRLELIKETTDGAFVTILLSLLGLANILLLTFISNSELFTNIGIDRILNIAFGSFCLLIIYQIFLLLIFMINRFRKLITVDTIQEKEYLESLKRKEQDEWETID